MRCLHTPETKQNGLSDKTNSDRFHIMFRWDGHNCEKLQKKMQRPRGQAMHTASRYSEEGKWYEEKRYSYCCAAFDIKRNNNGTVQRQGETVSAFIGDYRDS